MQLTHMYYIRFPRQPVDEVLERLKAAGLTYQPPLDPMRMGHSGVGGHWEGELTADVLTRLHLPEGTEIRQYQG